MRIHRKLKAGSSLLHRFALDVVHALRREHQSEEGEEEETFQFRQCGNDCLNCPYGKLGGYLDKTVVGIPLLPA